MTGPDLQAYFEEAARWEDDRQLWAERSEQRAWRVAMGAGLIALTAVGAVIGLTPLKTVKTEVLLLDKSTGQIQPLQALAEAQVDLPEVFHRKFINDFMLARENYTYDTAEANYYTAAAFMSPPLQAQWGQYYSLENPSGPLTVYKTDTKVRIDIHSITIHTKDDGRQDIATVRFTRHITRGSLESASRWVATVSFKYVNAPTEEKLRRINPVGFQVTDYQTDPEVGGDSPPIPPPLAAERPPN